MKALVPVLWTGRMPTPSFSYPGTSYRKYNPLDRAVRGEVTGIRLVEGELIVDLTDAGSFSQLQLYASRNAFSIVFVGSTVLNDVTIQTNAKSERDLWNIAKSLEQEAWVKRAVINSISEPSAIELKDPSWNTAIHSWNLADIRLKEAYAQLQADDLSGVTAGIIDDGAVDEHEEFGNYQRIGVSQVNPVNGWHGTSVAGIIGSSNNDKGTTGIAYNPRLLIGTTDLNDGYVRWLLQTPMAVKRARVVNMSFGHTQCEKTGNKDWGWSCVDFPTGFTQGNEEISVTTFANRKIGTLADLIRKHQESNREFLMVQASGNDGLYEWGERRKSKFEEKDPTSGNGIKIAADYSGNLTYLGLVTTETASTKADADLVSQHSLIVGAYEIADGTRKISFYTQLPARYTGYLGDSFILAPGSMGSIYTTTGPGKTEYRNNFNGTSAAAPHVSGVAALLFQINPSLTPPEVREIILSTADNNKGTSFAIHPTPGDGYDGYRYLNAEAAVKEALKRKNCGTITPPTIDGTTDPNSLVIEQQYLFRTTTASAGIDEIIGFEWETSDTRIPWSSTGPVFISFATTGNYQVKVSPVTRRGVCTTKSQTLQVTVLPPERLIFRERPDTGSGWNLVVSVTPTDLAGYNGTFNFGYGACTGRLRYEGKLGDDYVFAEIHETGGCFKTCDILIGPNADYYNEQCFGAPYNGRLISPLNRAWMTPSPTSNQLIQILGL